MCTLRWPLSLNFFWQMWHVNQAPSSCDSSWCTFSWWCHVKRSEQCLHEYGFAPVWVRTLCLQIIVCRKHLPTRTVILSYITVWMTLMYLIQMYQPMTFQFFCCAESVHADDIPIHMMYRNVLDIHSKHTASHLHVDVCVPQGYHFRWISSDKCDMWTKCLHCVTPADVVLVGYNVGNVLNSVYMSTALHQCEYEHDFSDHCL